MWNKTGGEMLDIRVECEKGTFKLRSCGVFVRDGKMLVDRARRFDGHIILGGHVRVGESTKDTILRETKEEMGIDAKIEKLICINENIFPLPNSDKLAHEMGYYYLLSSNSLPQDGFEFFEIENGVEIIHKYSWVNLNEVEENNVRPHWLAKMILDNKENYYYLSDQTK